MPVIINDFEVLVEPPASQAGGQATERGAAPPALAPMDIERIVRHFEERRNRLIAD